MSALGSVTYWLGELKDGDADAAEKIWRRYYRRLIGLARKRLQNGRRRAADEEDVVQDAFRSFFRGVSAGRFPRLNDRDDLWRLLVVITARRAFDQLKRERRERPDDVTFRARTEISRTEAAPSVAALSRIIGDEPTPEFAAQVVEQCQRLTSMLGDESLRRIALWRMEGHTTDEMARMLDCSRRTVARKLKTIRIIWSQEQDE